MWNGHLSRKHKLNLPFTSLQTVLAALRTSQQCLGPNRDPYEIHRPESAVSRRQEEKESSFYLLSRKYGQHLSWLYGPGLNSNSDFSLSLLANYLQKTVHHQSATCVSFLSLIGESVSCRGIHVGTNSCAWCPRETSIVFV